MERRSSTDYIYSPLRYPGGKACIFPFVSNLFYENQMIGINYAEPYAGGSGLALRLLIEEYVENIYINDLDICIYSFWKTILEDTDNFCEWIEDVALTVKNWHVYKEMQTNLIGLSQFEIAQATFFLNRTNVSGVIKGGVIGGLKQHGKYKIDARFNKPDLIKRIARIARFKKRIKVSNSDGLKFIDRLNKKQEDIFIYLDPPYYQKGADLYMNFYSNKDHSKLCKHVSEMKKKWMVSYDNHDFILNLYAERKKILYQLSQCASNRVGDEILMFSKGLRFKKAITFLNTPTIIAPS